MKKLLFVDHTLFNLGGIERVVSVLSSAFIEDGNTVSICSIYRTREKPFYHFNPEIKFEYLYDLTGLPSHNCTSKMLSVAFRCGERIIELFAVRKRIKKYIKENIEKYDAIAFGRIASALLFLPYLSQYKGRIIVRDANNFYYMKKYEKRRMRKLFPGSVDYLVVSSEESKSMYKDYLPDSSTEIVKIYNPLGISPVAEYDINNKTILGVGRYCRDKGFENLIYAFSLIHADHPEWQLTLIGSGDRKTKYDLLCEKLDISESVYFYQSGEMAGEYAKAGVFVMTSRAEGYANALVEAMACGVPSVSVDWYVGVEDIISDRTDGVIVRLHNRDKYYKEDGISKKDAEKLAKEIETLISLNELRQLYSDAAKEKMRISRNNTKIIHEWEKMIGE